MKQHRLLITACGLLLSFSATAQTQLKVKTTAADQPLAAASQAQPASAFQDYFRRTLTEKVNAKFLNTQVAGGYIGCIYGLDATSPRPANCLYSL